MQKDGCICDEEFGQPLLHTKVALVHHARESLPSDGNCATIVEDNAVRLVGHTDRSTPRLNVPAMGLVPVLVGEGPDIGRSLGGSFILRMLATFFCLSFSDVYHSTLICTALIEVLSTPAICLGQLLF